MIYLVTKREWFVEHEEIKCMDYEKYLDRIIDYLWKFDYLAVDSETEGLDCHTHRMFCYQIGTDECQFVIDHRVVPISAFKELLEEKLLIFVNAKFDLKFFYKQGIRPRFVVDLMLQEIILQNGLYTVAEFKGKSSFKGLSEKYLEDYDIDKTLGAAFTRKWYHEMLYPKEVLYSGKDVVNPLQIYRDQQEIIERRGLVTLCNMENNFVRALADIEFNGSSVDLSVIDYLKPQIEERRDKYKKLVEDLIIADKDYKSMTVEVRGKKQPVVAEYENQIGEIVKKCTISWSAPAQIQSVFTSLGIELEEDEDGKISIDKDELIKIRQDHPFVDAYLEMQRYNALLTKFVLSVPNYINKTTNKLHTDFFQIVSTGRLSSNKPNMQNMPKGDKDTHIRDFFVADPGELMVTSDFSGCELRILAEASQDPLWVNTFIEGRDLHSVVASEIFNIPIDNVKDPFPLKPELEGGYRFVTKTINFGLAYGMSAVKLSNTIGSTVEEAQKIIDTYFSKVPKVKEYLEKSGKLGVANLVSYTFDPIFRPRYYPDEQLALLQHEIRYQKWLTSGGKNKKPKSFNWRALQGSYERASMNHPIQGCNADLVKIALTNLYDYIHRHKYPAKLVNTVHDEIVTSVRYDLAEEWKVIQEGEMIKAAQIFIKSLPVVVESKIDVKWTK